VGFIALYYASSRLPSGLSAAVLGLTYHFDNKSMRGYHLTIAKGGNKLKESTREMKQSPSAGADGGHGFGQGEEHSHISEAHTHRK
jgi:uncharacterized protein (TIGR03435 family)